MDRPFGPVPTLGGSFESLQPSISTWILEVIRKMGFDRMTPVQASTIPRALKNQDCVVEAVTGSGKTLAFVIPVLERLCRMDRRYQKGEIAAIVIAPTRELAQQIHDVFHLFLSSLHPEEQETGSLDGSPSRSISSNVYQAGYLYPLPLLVTSGTKNPYETLMSQSSNILIGTPGRLASFLLAPRGLSTIRCSETDMLVLDEADRLLSAPDHRRDIERIIRHLPKQRRTHLFSATMTDAVEELIGLGLRNPVRIVVNLKDQREGQELVERRTPSGLQNMFLVCRHSEKTLQLIRLLLYQSEAHDAAKYIVYFSTGAAVDYFYRILSHLPTLSRYHLTSLHGDLLPRIREKALSTFTSHPSTHLTPAVLLCTDVAARGVDFADINVVIQYDPPTDPKTFSHRAGRTARAGKSGTAVVLLGKGREEDYIDFLSVRKIPLSRHPYLNANLEEITSTITPDADASRLMLDIRKVVQTDRDLADRGAKAFVSALHAYTKHEASFIFRLANLDLGSVATAYGLLRLPAMPEVKAWRRKRDEQTRAMKDGTIAQLNEEVDWADAGFDWDNYAYISKQREAARLVHLAAKKEKNALVADETKRKRKIRAEMRTAWSEQKEKRVRKDDRRSRKEKRKQLEWEKARANGVQDMHPKAESKLVKQIDQNGEEDIEYKALKREVQEERASKRREYQNLQGGESGGLFEDME